ncbi:MAG: glutamate--tRNA ligase [Acidobacteria bacterium]|nr:glutamate--tRNA ligase [Acidobacteriota bacterium]MCI0620736.1 glutamate--tRNA ligase [Acidobacteriota bacterium]MCI0719705.1 glutamate--tRNA ligase [Acidobacteriota bacterium]
MSSNIRVRFAPSPTGHLHVGNVRTAIFNWLFVRKAGGQFVIRIEDTDIVRSEERFEGLIYEDLRWLGLQWEEAPDVGGPYSPYRQSDRLNLYREKALKLVGNQHAYHCFCSEAELERQAEKAKRAGVTWKYPGTCQTLAGEEVRQKLDRGDASVIRLKVRQGPIRFRDLVHGDMEFSSDVISEPILIRSNGSPTYNYAVVVDDALMQITHVIRGDDHLSNTPKQVLIYEAFGWTLPLFAHLSTILGSDHTRLSKRHGATSVKNLQDMGMLPEALLNYLALLGWAPSEGQSEILPLDALIQSFELERVSKSAAVFDLNKLYWINRHYLKEADRSRVLNLAIPFLRQAGLLAEVNDAIREWAGQIIEAVLPGVDHLSQIPDKAAFIFSFDPGQALKAEAVRQVLSEGKAGEVLRALNDELAKPGQEIPRDWKEIIAAVKNRTGQKGKQLFHPIRVALTGSDSGPELDKLLPIFERGSRLALPRRILCCQERVARFAAAVDANS